MNVILKQNSISVSNKVINILKQTLKIQGLESEVSLITFNYRDSSYSIEHGGYHPVEIALQKEQCSEYWHFLYITDFSYCGGPFAELCKELDFDFDTQTFSGAFVPSTSFSHRSVQEMFKMWQDNFLSYLEYGAFDEIEVTTC